MREEEDFENELFLSHGRTRCFFAFVDSDWENNILQTLLQRKKLISKVTLIEDVKNTPPLERMLNVLSFEIKKMKNDFFHNYYKDG